MDHQILRDYGKLLIFRNHLQLTTETEGQLGPLARADVPGPDRGRRRRARWPTPRAWHRGALPAQGRTSSTAHPRRAGRPLPNELPTRVESCRGCPSRDKTPTRTAGSAAGRAQWGQHMWFREGAAATCSLDEMASAFPALLGRKRPTIYLLRAPWRGRPSPSPR